MRGARRTGGIHPWFAELIAPGPAEDLATEEDDWRAKDRRRRRSRPVMTLRRSS